MSAADLWVERHALEVAREGRLLAGRLHRWMQENYPSMSTETRRVYNALRDEVAFREGRLKRLEERSG